MTASASWMDSPSYEKITSRQVGKRYRLEGATSDRFLTLKLGNDLSISASAVSKAATKQQVDSLILSREEP
jgi:hypothetical protein